jgi:hypothetical protein
MEPVRCGNGQSLQRRVDRLQAENERLRRQLDEATRAGKRQAAPQVSPLTYDPEFLTPRPDTSRQLPRPGWWRILLDPRR